MTKMSNWRRAYATGAVVMAASAVMLTTAGPAAAETSALPDSDQQVAYENELAGFLDENPAPTPVNLSSSIPVQNAYWENQAEWLAQVPWEAVAGQWGCVSSANNIVLNAPTEEGLITATYSGLMNCSSDLNSTELAVVAEPITRSSYAAPSDPGVVARDIKPVGESYCDFPGGTERFCINQNGTTLTATFQWNGTGTKTGRVRLGQSDLSSCTAGTQMAISGLGTGGSGAVWYASSSVSANANWSNSFLYTDGALYARWCALI